MAIYHHGGVVFIKFMSGSSTLICYNSNLNRNQATSNGGAVYTISNVSTQVEILYCKFTDNMAVGGHGGAVFMNLINRFSTQNCSSSYLSRNQATHNGGAIYISQGGKYVWKEISFSENSAEMGRAVYLDTIQTQNTKQFFLL